MLRKNDFTVSENSGCINVYSDGVIQAKIFDSETISAPRSNSGEAYFRIKDIARTVSEYCSAYEKALDYKAELSNSARENKILLHFMNNRGIMIEIGNRCN